MATVDDLRRQFSRYWDPDHEDSFHQITVRLKETAKKTDGEREEAIANFSKMINLLPNHPNLTASVKSAKGLIRDRILEVKAIQNALSPAYSIEFQAREVSHAEDTFSGDRASFKKRLETLTEDIHAVYRNSIYPFLLSLQNAEKGWDPAGSVCIASDYFYWRMSDAEGELAKVFPEEMLSRIVDML